MLYRCRIAMVRSEREQLSGVVELDESLVGGVGHGGKRGCGSDTAIVAIAVEIKDPMGFGRVRMKHIPDASRDELVPFVCAVVLLGRPYKQMGGVATISCKKMAMYTRRRYFYPTGDPVHISMPGVHRIASLLKRWILGTHQGSVSDEYLQSYLEEFTFRFNRRDSRSRGMVFRRLPEQIVVTDPIIDAEIAHGFDW